MKPEFQSRAIRGPSDPVGHNGHGSDARLQVRNLSLAACVGATIREADLAWVLEGGDPMCVKLAN